jgi:hypothetical protein
LIICPNDIIFINAWNIHRYTWKFLCLHGLCSFTWVTKNIHKFFNMDYYDMSHMTEFCEDCYYYNFDMWITYHMWLIYASIIAILKLPCEINIWIIFPNHLRNIEKQNPFEFQNVKNKFTSYLSIDSPSNNIYTMWQNFT